MGKQRPHVIEAEPVDAAGSELVDDSPLPRSCRTESGVAKIRYGSEVRARHVLQRAQRTDRHLLAAHVYLCGECGGWHLGRRPRRKRLK